MMGEAMCTPLFHNQFRVPTYEDWVDNEADWSHVYDFHLRQLQHLQWHNPRDRWVLKTGAHMWGLEHLLVTYPDARIVFTHRDPVKSVTSYASLTTLVRETWSDDVDRFEIAAGLDGAAAARASTTRIDVREARDVPGRDLLRHVLPRLRGRSVRGGAATSTTELDLPDDRRGRDAHAGLHRRQPEGQARGAPVHARGVRHRSRRRAARPDASTSTISTSHRNRRVPDDRGKPENPSGPGWYPDPWSADGKGERYFDGKRWGTTERPRRAAHHGRGRRTPTTHTQLEPVPRRRQHRGARGPRRGVRRRAARHERHRRRADDVSEREPEPGRRAAAAARRRVVGPADRSAGHPTAGNRRLRGPRGPAAGREDPDRLRSVPSHPLRRQPRRRARSTVRSSWKPRSRASRVRRA